MLLLCLSVSHVAAEQKAPLEDEADRINYTIGHQIGSDFKRQQIELNEQAVRQGIEDGTQATAPQLEAGEMQEFLLDLKRNITDDMKEQAIARVQARKRDEEEKRSRGKAFLEANQAKEGVKTLPSGLQYKIMTPGSGAKPQTRDRVTLNYEARTLEGKLFSSSKLKGKPTSMTVNGVISGLTEALQMMQPGAKWELYIPPELAYGRQGPLAHQTIIIDVELVSIDEQSPPQQTAPTTTTK
jgi:FKBP-type peptidyl-prolyl cis-trans isomerase FklB